MAEELKPFEEIDTLHELLGVALDDMAAVLRDNDYRIHMGHWHVPANLIDSDHRRLKHGVCLVCLAGSVMAKTMGASRDRHLDPRYNVKDICTDRLLALDHMRSGELHLAHRALHGPSEKPELARLREKWARELQKDGLNDAIGRVQGRALYTKLREMQSDLEKAGL